MTPARPSRYGSGWHSTPGDEVETLLYNRASVFEFVSDSVCLWHDFRATHPVSIDDEAAVVDADAVRRDGPIEAKACALEQSNGAGQTTAGRWWQARRNHEMLADRDGAYLLAVYWPSAFDPLVALLTVDAARFDELVSWTSTGSGSGTRDECAKLAWSRVFDRDTIVERAGGERR